MPTASPNHISDPPYQNQAKVCICETAIENPSENLEVVKNNYCFFSILQSAQANVFICVIESEKYFRYFVIKIICFWFNFKFKFNFRAKPMYYNPVLLQLVNKICLN